MYLNNVGRADFRKLLKPLKSKKKLILVCVRALQTAMSRVDTLGLNTPSGIDEFEAMLRQIERGKFAIVLSEDKEICKIRVDGFDISTIKQFGITTMHHYIVYLLIDALDMVINNFWGIDNDTNGFCGRLGFACNLLLDESLVNMSDEQFQFMRQSERPGMFIRLYDPMIRREGFFFAYNLLEAEIEKLK